MPLISVGELIDRSWEHYRREFADLVSVSGWLLLVALVDIVSLAIYPSASSMLGNATLTASESVGVTLYGFANVVLAPVVGLWTFVALVRLVRSQLSGRRDGVREAMGDAWRYFFPTMLVSALVALLMAAVALVAFGPFAILSWIAAVSGIELFAALAGISVVVGVMAAIALGFRWSVRYYLAPYALLVDETRGRAALSTSRSLTEGRFWSVLLRAAIPKIVFVVLAILAVSVIAFVFSVASGAMAGLNLDVQLRLSSIGTSVLSVLAAVLLNPLIVTADLMLYQSLKR